MFAGDNPNQAPLSRFSRGEAYYETGDQNSNEGDSCLPIVDLAPNKYVTRENQFSGLVDDTTSYWGNVWNNLTGKNDAAKNEDKALTQPLSMATSHGEVNNVISTFQQPTANGNNFENTAQAAPGVGVGTPEQVAGQQGIITIKNVLLAGIGLSIVALLLKSKSNESAD